MRTQDEAELVERLILKHLPALDGNGERIATALERIATVLKRPLQECTTTKRVRNEAAVCGNCPYMAPCENEREKNYGVCCLSPMTANSDSLVMPDKSWCGQHPDFWKES